MKATIEKTLPQYPLHYYEKNYVEKPHIFHLSFIDESL